MNDAEDEPIRCLLRRGIYRLLIQSLKAEAVALGTLGTDACRRVPMGHHTQIEEANVEIHNRPLV